jgi:hypothetical protein
MADGNSNVRDSAARKAQPIATGVLAYFPRALALVSEISRRGNDKHNPGEPLHWAREKSTDEADSCVRHVVDALAEGPLAVDAEGAPHIGSALWRLLAWTERVLDGDERWRTVAKPTALPSAAVAPHVVEERARVDDAVAGLEASTRVVHGPRNVPHSPGFFAQMSSCREAYKRLALAFDSVLFASWTVLDFGCGIGHQTAALARMGYDIHGIDPLVPTEAVEPGFSFVSGDPIGADVELVGGHFNAVICTEVAEHVYPERADDLVRSVCELARNRVIWSAAKPGQEWEGHVNLQPTGYWIDRFAANGFQVNEAATEILRDDMRSNQAQHAGAADNFFVLDRTPRA